MIFEEYLAIRNMENPLDFVTNILVKSIYPECYSISPELNNGTVFVKEFYNSKGEYFDIYGNRGKDIFNDPVTNNRVAIDVDDYFVNVKRHREERIEYVGNDSVEKLTDYLLVCPMLFTILPEKLIKNHGDELMTASISSLKKHFILYTNHIKDRGFNGRYVRNIRGAALANNISGGALKIYRKYLNAKGFSEAEAKRIIDDKKYRVDKENYYISKVENLLAFSSEIKKLDREKVWEIISSFFILKSLKINFIIFF